MKKSLVLLPFLLPALACPCPTLDSVSGEASLRSCVLDPKRPIQVGSQFDVEITSEGGTSNWTLSDPTVIDWNEDEAQLEALGVGSGALNVELEDGSTDSFEFEVVQAVSATLEDPITAIVVAQLADDPGSLHGDLPVPDLGSTILVREGQGVALELHLATEDGDLVGWSTSALEVGGNVTGFNTGVSVWIEGAGAGTVSDADGTVLLTTDVQEVPAGTASSIALGAFPTERTEALDSAEGPQLAGYLRAVVTNADGAMIHQPDVVWTMTGPGTVVSFADGTWETLPRTDVAEWNLHEDDYDRWEKGTACIVATVQTADGSVAASAWMTPDGVEVSADGTCSGQSGCACSSAERLDPRLSFLPVALLALGRRRQRPLSDQS
jgi:hypothetical protein